MHHDYMATSRGGLKNPLKRHFLNFDTLFLENGAYSICPEKCARVAVTVNRRAVRSK